MALDTTPHRRAVLDAPDDEIELVVMQLKRAYRNDGVTCLDALVSCANLLDVELEGGDEV